VSDRLTDLIIDSISNVRRELKFFEDVAARYSLDITAADEKGKEKDVSDGVKGYRELFNGIGEKIEAGKLDIQAGLVLLWGTEKVGLPGFLHPLNVPLMGRVFGADDYIIVLPRSLALCCFILLQE